MAAKRQGLPDPAAMGIVVTAILGGLGAWIILYGVFTQLLELFLFEGFVTRLLIS